MVHYSFLLVVLFSAVAFGYSGTALDDYVNTPDDVYSYTLINSTTTPWFKLYALRVTTQSWQTSEFSDHPVWNHTMWICVPKTVIYATHGFYFINGGSDGDRSNAENLDVVFTTFCNTSGAISTLLYQIPNQPIRFRGSQQGLTEDYAIAYTFRSFLNESGSNPSQILQFPMTKSAVRGLDALQDFGRKNLGVNLQTFCVAGASKRGWATWLHAAVDPRVVAIMPMVIQLLNTKENILNVWRGLGEWGFALDAYTQQHVFDYNGTPQFDLLMSLVDPLTYNDRYGRIQKLVIDASFDQFFMLDGPKYFWKQLAEPKWLAIIPNADHGFSTPGSVNTLFPLLVAFFSLTAQSVPVPSVTWEKVLSNVTSALPSLTVTASQPTRIVDAQVFSVTTTRPGFRDFRISTCSAATTCLNYIGNGVAFTPTRLSPVAVSSDNATFSAVITNLPPITSNVRDQRWLGFFVQLTFLIPLRVGPSVYLQLTSEANIFPDFYPFAPHVSDFAAIGLCNYTTTFEQTLTGGWSDGNGNTFTTWTVTLLNTHDLYSAQIEVYGPITQIWGVEHVSGNVYKIPDYQYQNGVIPANTNNIQFSYITQSSDEAHVSLVNDANTNACYPSTSSACQVSITPVTTGEWSDGTSVVFQSVSINVQNAGSATAANTQIKIDLLNGASLTQTWNLALVSSSGSSSVYTCPLYNLPAGQTSSSCGYIIKSPTGALPAASLSSPQTICL